MKIFDSQCNFYVPSFFWIELNTAKEMKEIFNSDIEHCFFHEYIHFLEDITTTYGYANASCVLNQIKAIYHAIKMKEQLHDYELALPFDFSHDMYRDVNINLFKTYLRYYDCNNNVINKFCINKIDPVIVNIKGYRVQTFTVNYNENKEIGLGAHALFESISHILQKSCYNITDNKIYLPYDLPERVALYYSKLFVNKQYLIDLCEYSLMFFNACEVFMNILTGIKKDNYTPNDSNEFYLYMKNQVSLKDKSIEKFLEQEKDELISNINGVFVSELYQGFKKWMLDIIERGFKLKTDNKLIFSKLLKYDPTQFLHDSIIDIGMPPTFNQDGKMFIRNSIFDVNSSNYLTRAITSVFETLTMGKKSCSLKEACLISNEIREKQIKMDAYCDNEPWKKQNEEEICPFCAIWKTFGLSKMNISYS